MKKGVKKVVSAIGTIIIAAGCVGGIYLSQKGVNIGDEVKDVNVKDIANSISNDNNSKLSEKEKRRQLIMGDDPFDVTYAIEAYIKYDKNNKKGIMASNYGDTNEEKEYMNYLYEDYEKRIKEGGPKWSMDGIQTNNYNMPKDRFVNIGEKFRDPQNKVDYTVNSISITKNIKDYDYSIFWVGDYNKNFDKIIDKKTGDIKNGIHDNNDKEADIVFLKANISLKSYCQWITELCLDSKLIEVNDEGDYLRFTDVLNDSYNPSIGCDGVPIYFSENLYAGTKYEDYYLYYPMEYGEEKTIELGWLVDRNRLKENVVLQFGTDSSYYSDDLFLIDISRYLKENGCL